MASLADTNQLPSGPFLNVKHRGLIWVGNPEQCDRCKEIYPMCWIEFTGTHFLCNACHWDVTVEGRSVTMTVSEDLNLIEPCGHCFKYFSIEKMTIDYNVLVCRPCAAKSYAKRRYEAELEFEERRRKELKEALEKEKLLPPAEREERERERTKAYYDRMCS
jgi:hypothetical protein